MSKEKVLFSQLFTTLWRHAANAFGRNGAFGVGGGLIFCFKCFYPVRYTLQLDRGVPFSYAEREDSKTDVFRWKPAKTEYYDQEVESEQL